MPNTDPRIDELLARDAQRMSGDELRQSFTELLFITQQLGSISEGWRTDLLSMRGDIRRLSTLCEAALGVRGAVAAWQPGDPERRQADRRQAERRRGG